MLLRMRFYIFFLFLIINNLYSQEYSRSIDFLEVKRILHNKNYVDVQNFSNSVYKEDNPCMVYFERIETNIGLKIVSISLFINVNFTV